GYLGFAFYSENIDKLKIVPIVGGNGPIVPTVETINSGVYAPLSRPVFIYINPVALDDPAVATFAEFYLSNVGRLAGDVGYVPLPDSVYDAAKSRVAERITGSAYGENATLEKITGN
ncbi:MAG: hypothetical protein JJ934_15165, partial [Pseudomonadales bacterium]|nr:hypothetical protein [Pseudomonadales bacterium]